MPTRSRNGAAAAKPFNPNEPAHFKGSVTDSDKPPSGHYWDTLAETNTKEGLEDLLDHLDAHRYNKEGQLYTAVMAKLSEIGGGKRRRH